MSKKNSKRPEQITRKNFKRPKKWSTYNYKQWLNNFMDLNNWSQNKGRAFDWDKKIGRRKTAYINSCLTYTVDDYEKADSEDIKKAAIKRSSPKPSKKLIHTHLKTTEKELYLYYCNTSYTDIPLLCIDLDVLVDEETGEILTTLKDLKAAEEYISQILPSYYAEPSTRKKGLHYYFHVDFTDCWATCDSDKSNNFKHYADLVKYYITQLSHILKEQVNSRFNVDFDAIKGTMTRYIIHSSGYPIIDRSGVFCKLPIPHNQSEFDQLVHLVPVSFDSLYSYIMKKPLSSSVSSSGKESDSGKAQDNNNNKKKRSTTVCGDFLDNTQKNPSKTSKNKDNTKSEYSSSDVITRSREVGMIYFRNYWKEHNKRPSCEEYRQHYRAIAGTGTETPENKERLEKVYEWLVEHFDSTRINNSLYSVGEFIPFLAAENITDDQLDLMRQAHTKYTKKVRLIDLDLMLGHFFTLLMSNKDGKRITLKSFTCPTKAIPPFFQSQKEYYKGRKVKGYKVPTCDNCKAKSIKIILEHLGLLECLDPSYSNRSHTAMRWFLTKKFPRYKELEDYLGKDLIESFTNSIKLKTA